MLSLHSSVNRCQLPEKDIEIKEMKDQLNELVALLKQSEAQRNELLKEQKMREQAVVLALATSASVRFSAHRFIIYMLTYIAHCTLFSFYASMIEFYISL